jgi:hypothetical protein
MIKNNFRFLLILLIMLLNSCSLLNINYITYLNFANDLKNIIKIGKNEQMIKKYNLNIKNLDYIFESKKFKKIYNDKQYNKIIFKVYRNGEEKRFCFFYLIEIDKDKVKIGDYVPKYDIVYKNNDEVDIIFKDELIKNEYNHLMFDCSLQINNKVVDKTMVYPIKNNIAEINFMKINNIKNIEKVLEFKVTQVSFSSVTIF